MREILFRGKRVDDGEWAEGFYTLYANGKGVHPCILTGTDKGCVIPQFVIPETVGQFTGLYDKNGTKVFEGDIIAYKYKPNPYLNTFAIGRYTVEYFEILGVYAPFGDSDFALGANEVEVIGNIHDNPELLEH